MEGIYRDDLKTNVLELSYDFVTRTAALIMPDGCCTDMEGAIELFRSIDPNVTSITTVSGGSVDTEYVLEGGGWRARANTRADA